MTTCVLDTLAPLVRKGEQIYDRLKYKLYYALGGPGPIKIQPYRGYGTADRLYLKGRVLEDRGITPAGESDSPWQNFINMWKRMASREVPHAKLVARFQGQEQEVVADEEGMFEVWVEPKQPLPPEKHWHSITLELREPRSKQQEGTVRATGQVLVPLPTANFAVISDIDDTVLQTGAPDRAQMLRNALVSNARTRLPLPGVAAFYRALHAGQSGHDGNPLLYVSNSPWNLYDLLVEFFDLHDIPIGPVLFLRNWGVYKDELLPTDHRKYKLPVIRQMVDLYADLPFILIGDSSEADPEIYYEIVQRYPGRVLAIYIHDVGKDLERPAAIRALAEQVVEAGSTLVLAENSLILARHAARQGWIQHEALAHIEEELPIVT